MASSKDSATRQDNSSNRILWAVDALASDEKRYAHMGKALKKFCSGCQADITPVYLIQPANLDLINPESFIAYLDGAQLKLKAKLDKALAKLSLQGLKPSQMLRVEHPSMKKAVLALIEYGEKNKADLIAVSSHAKKGLARAFLGSFAETLLLHSTLPVFVANPSFPVKTGNSKILFPTDFGKNSENIFTSVVKLAQAQRSTIVLMSKMERTSLYLFPEFQPPYAAEYFKQEAATREKRAAQWQQRGQKQGVKVEVFIDRSKGDVASAILKAAKKFQIGMIALASESGTLRSNIIGSITRKVLRNATCPIWVQHVSA